MKPKNSLNTVLCLSEARLMSAVESIILGQLVKRQKGKDCLSVIKCAKSTKSMKVLSLVSLNRVHCFTQQAMRLRRLEQAIHQVLLIGMLPEDLKPGRGQHCCSAHTAQTAQRAATAWAAHFFFTCFM